ncbi:hypothetical protein METBIDRAFT_64594 [Metschnikowia bicuspidata var. bicuspidata NRRL YB-4993]|uniref:PAN2-PAN3 deadenylation complex subunit PAN3 n=1 Tax=Metschnikowia bicuspidata var. bicuspidata NRRL YB-4993 TaxID=869754 RepID=A0A1A0HIF8_9ASCO|nr:hypothetical protein METBIDRAFT_64594 [Metschnikowia bicuspidata var. bicuspidata NRRL YB-4993]OBA23623.1 hypothetical protein METBIDRAFT_64594 [Metschnikowia bicuspidata var. bicuspidata NRRL YB-4993]
MNINPESAKEIPCKNVLIYGYCKFENKGCVFSHPLPENAQSPESTNAVATPTDSKRKFNMNTPSFQPSVLSMTSKFAALSPKVKEIPIFVPSSAEPSSTAHSTANHVTEPPSAAHNSFSARKFNTSTPSFTPSNGFASHYGQLSSSNTTLAFVASSQVSQQAAQPKQQNPYLNAPVPTVAASSANSISTSDYLFHSQGTQSFPLNHHLYAPAPPPRLVAPLKSYETNVNSMFIPNNLRETLTKKNEATLQTMPQLSLPEHVGVYHSLVPIDASFEQPSNVYDLPSYMYKVLSNSDGLPYALRRIDQGHKLRVLNEMPFANVKKWKALKSPNVARLNDAFTSISLSTNGEPSLFFAYDYYPLASTLQEHHITRRLGGKLEPITEELLWTYLVQLTGALLCIHEAGLHAGSSLALSKVLVTNKNRVRLSAVGVDDILEYESFEELKQQLGEENMLRKLQQDDVVCLGKLMTDLASTVLPASLRSLPVNTLLEHLQKSSIMTLSPEMSNALSALHCADEWFDLGEFYATHLSRASIKVLNGFQDLSDFFEGQLLSEVENGRLFRLLAKINVVLDRPENEGDAIGSTFVIKLFRDYLFHTVDESGKPAVDLSKILVNLNKLDVGVDEKILLISREEDSCIIVSYKEVKDTLDLNFRSLIR